MYTVEHLAIGSIILHDAKNQYYCCDSMPQLQYNVLGSFNSKTWANYGGSNPHGPYI